MNWDKDESDGGMTFFLESGYSGPSWKNEEDGWNWAGIPWPYSIPACVSALPPSLKTKAIYEDYEWALRVLPKCLLDNSPRPWTSARLNGIAVSAPVRTVLRYGWEVIDEGYVVTPIPYHADHGIGPYVLADEWSADDPTTGAE